MFVSSEVGTCREYFTILRMILFLDFLESFHYIVAAPSKIVVELLVF